MHDLPCTFTGQREHGTEPVLPAQEGSLCLLVVPCCLPSIKRVKVPRSIGSEHTLGGVQGPRMVRDVFRLAKENAPAIIFIDEVDAIATARFDAQTGADRCVCFLETSRHLH